MSPPNTGWPPLDFYLDFCSALLRSAQATLPSVASADSGSDTHDVVLAPKVLTQPINPGWIFGNVSITSNNSRDPEAEREIMEAVSYGRQLGRIMDAVAVLITQTDPSKLKPEQQRAFDEFREIEVKIRAVKAKAMSRWLSVDGMTELACKLHELKTDDRETYDRLTRILHSALET